MWNWSDKLRQSKSYLNEQAGQGGDLRGNHLCTLNNRMTIFIKYHIQHTLKSTDVDYWANLQKEKLTGISHMHVHWLQATKPSKQISSHVVAFLDRVRCVQPVWMEEIGGWAAAGREKGRVSGKRERGLTYSERQLAPWRSHVPRDPAGNERHLLNLIKGKCCIERKIVNNHILKKIESRKSVLVTND